MKRLLLPLLASMVLMAACHEDLPRTVANARPELTRPLLPLDAQKATDLLIPEHAIVMRGGVPGVFVLDNNEARFRMIKPGEKRGSQQQVLSGLGGNETLVVGSLQEVHDGSRIRADK